MEDVLAIRVLDKVDVPHYFLVWGRTYGSVEYDRLLGSVRKHLGAFGLDAATIREMSVLPTLTEAAMHGPYFHECLFDMLLTRFEPPGGQSGDRRDWFAYVHDQMETGAMLWYLGDPTTPRSVYRWAAQEESSSWQADPEA